MTATYELHRWDDEVITANGYSPSGEYLYSAWAGCVGPTPVLLYRHLVDRLYKDADGTPVVNVPTMAALLGVGEGQVIRTLFRLKQYGLVRWVSSPDPSPGPSVLHVRTALPPLTRRQRQRLRPAHPMHLGTP